MKDFLLFRKMISPWLIQLLFWLVLIFFIYTAVIDILHQVDYLLIFEFLIIGPLAARVVAELLILLFRINDHLVQINNKLNDKER